MVDLSIAQAGELFTDNYGDEWEYIGITKHFSAYASYIMQGGAMILRCDKQGNGGNCLTQDGKNYKMMDKNG